MIDISNVSKRYGKSSALAVDNITLHINNGKIFGLIGPNGAGKSTLIHMMTGLIIPTAGEITIDGVSMQNDSVNAKQKIGYVPDNQELYPRLTGMEYLTFIADIYGVSLPERKRAIDKYLSMFEMVNAVSQQIRTYSRGMKQKLSIIGALMHNPPVWILDEPMVGLDPKAAHLLKQEMRNHCLNGNSVFFSTHVLEVAENLCDEIAIIDHGKIVADGTMAELRNKSASEGQSSLEQLFLQLTEDGATVGGKDNG